MFKKLHLTTPTLRFGLSSGPPLLILEPPPPKDNYCTVPKASLNALAFSFIHNSLKLRRHPGKYV